MKLSNEDRKTQWLIFIISIFFLKILIFCLDPLPKFFLGDSRTFILSALLNYIPPDRSFIYAYVIKFIAVPSHSLTSLIILQVTTSALASILLAYVLVKFFSTSPSLAFLCGLLCSLDPLQLIYERFVLTECLALFVFVIYLILVFHYLKLPRLLIIALVQIVGTVLIGFRLSFLPLVLINSILLPLLIIPELGRRYSVKFKPLTGCFWHMLSKRSFIGVFAMHLVASVVLTLSLHSAYKSLNGFLSHKPPAYLYESGFFLLTAWAPVINPVDFPRPDIVNNVFGQLKYDLSDRKNRGFQRWVDGGLIENIKHSVDFLEADRLARATAINALKRDPLGLASLSLLTFKDYFDTEMIHRIMHWELKNYMPLSDYGFDKSLLDHFGISPEHLPYLRTLTSRYYFAAWPWYLLLPCMPFLAFVALLVCGKEIRKYSFVVFLSSFFIIAVASSLTSGIWIRYLHAIGWLSFLVIGQLLDRTIKKWGSLID
jgi:hypothetical protein